MLSERPGQNVFELPSHFTSIQSNDAALRYMTNNHVMEAYANHLVDMRYDPRMNRAVFLVRHEGRVVNAVGRALKKGSGPKWWHYGRDDRPFMVGSGSVGVVVEDCASACAVSSFATGIALLGTAFKRSAMQPLKSLSRVIIALDPDATRKALELSRTLSYYAHSVALRRLPNDLKYFSPAEAANVLGIEG